MLLLESDRIMSVWILTAIAWLFSLTSVPLIVTIIAGGLSASYTVWRWVRDYKEHKRKKLLRMRNKKEELEY